MVNVKKPLMLMVWRFQQINSMIIIVGLTLSLTFQVYPYIGWRFVKLGISQDHDWLIMLIIFLIIFTFAVFVGMIYDSILKLWIQQAVVTIERQPYAKEKFVAKGLINRQFMWIPLLRKANLKTEEEFNIKWNERNMEDDPNLRKDVYRVIDWVNNYKLQPADKRWLKDLEEIVKKPYAPKTKDLIK